VAGETRAVIWLIPWIGLGTLGAILRIAPAWRATVVVFTVMLLLAFDLKILQLPVQPIRDAVSLAHDMATPGQPIFGLYMALDVPAQFPI
jgi:hypothetical protein